MTLHDDFTHDAFQVNVSARVNVGVPVALKSIRKLTVTEPDTASRTARGKAA